MHFINTHHVGNICLINNLSSLININNISLFADINHVNK